MTYYCVETENKHVYTGFKQLLIRVQVKDKASNSYSIKLIPYSQKDRIRKLRKTHVVKIFYNITQLSLF